MFPFFSHKNLEAEVQGWSGVWDAESPFLFIYNTWLPFLRPPDPKCPLELYPWYPYFSCRKKGEREGRSLIHAYMKETFLPCIPATLSQTMQPLFKVAIRSGKTSELQTGEQILSASIPYLRPPLLRLLWAAVARWELEWRRSHVTL